MMPGCVIFAAEAFIHQFDGGALERDYDDIIGLYLWK
jgi:hypothetical protein